MSPTRPSKAEVVTDFRRSQILDAGTDFPEEANGKFGVVVENHPETS